jgi:hypothetical protein
VDALGSSDGYFHPEGHRVVEDFVCPLPTVAPCVPVAAQRDKRRRCKSTVGSSSVPAHPLSELTHTAASQEGMILSASRSGDLCQAQGSRDMRPFAQSVLLLRGCLLA